MGLFTFFFQGRDGPRRRRGCAATNAAPRSPASPTPVPNPRRKRCTAGLAGFLLALFGFCAAPPAGAHEPLWGETPTVFGFGVIHPEIRFGYRDAGSTRRGGLRSRMLETETMIQYAPSTALNLQLEVPWMQGVREQRRGGVTRRVVLGGLGDLALTAKRRFSVHQDVGLMVQHSLLYGLKLPTGENRHRDADGRRAAPHDQPGTGRPGLILGYAWDRERLSDTLWASFRYRRDLGGGFRMGDMLEADSAYGRWLIRPNEASQLGFNLALGLHGEVHASDPLGGGRNAENAHHLLGVQLTPIFTKGNHQVRFGLLIPFSRSGPGDHSDFPAEFRFAFETFF